MERRVAEAWFGTVPRVVLEALFARGRLGIAERRVNFARAYDLAERLIPESHRERMLAPADADRELIRRAARAYGIATADDLADYYRMPVRDARPRLAELVDAGELESVRVEGWSSTHTSIPRRAFPGAGGRVARIALRSVGVAARPASRLFHSTTASRSTPPPRSGNSAVLRAAIRIG